MFDQLQQSKITVRKAVQMAYENYQKINQAKSGFTKQAKLGAKMLWLMLDNELRELVEKEAA